MGLFGTQSPPPHPNETMKNMMQFMMHQQQQMMQQQMMDHHQQMMQRQYMMQQQRMMQHCMNANHPQLPHEGFGHIRQSMPQGLGASLIRGCLGIPPGFTSLRYENGIPFDEA